MTCNAERPCFGGWATCDLPPGHHGSHRMQAEDGFAIWWPVLASG